MDNDGHGCQGLCAKVRNVILACVLAEKMHFPGDCLQYIIHDAIPRRPWLLQAGCTKNVLDQVHVMSLH
jgi:hypothetical protein